MSDDASQLPKALASLPPVILTLTSRSGDVRASAYIEPPANIYNYSCRNSISQPSESSEWRIYIKFDIVVDTCIRSSTRRHPLTLPRTSFISSSKERVDPG